MRRLSVALCALLLAATGGAAGQPASTLRGGAAGQPASTLRGGAAGQPASTLRVGTSGDYSPFSIALGGADADLEGFDVAVARAYAEERGLALEFVRFRWPDLVTALSAGRFDVAMSGVTVRPERSAAGRFTVPVVESGAVLLVRQPGRWSEPEHLDRPGIRIGFNAGGHLQRVAEARFSRAVLVAIRDNGAVRQALLDHNLHAAVSDTLEVLDWQRGTEGLAVIGPFTRDRKAYLVRPDRSGLASDLDAWLLARERDGTLAELRREHLAGATGPAVATPLGALLAALDERLSLMPLVGVAKRKSGLPLEIPEREALVLDAAVAGVHAAAHRTRNAAPPDAAVRAFFRAQMEAAKEVQWEAVQDLEYRPPEPLPDFDAGLRPGLLRIGDRIAELLLVLPPQPDADRVRSAARDALHAPYLSQRSARTLADAIVAVANAPRAPAQPGQQPQR
jgi:cyclohexadienyl dehydratase